MHSRFRLLLLALGLLSSARHASAQFVELVTEAPVTFQITVTTTAVTETATERKTTATVSRLGQADVINELRGAGIIPATPADGWTLVAVRVPPADLAFVDAGFRLYAVNGSTHVPVPESKFKGRAYGSVAKYKERHSGQYVLDSAGTVTAHVAYDYLPSWTIGSTRYNVQSSTTDGFATIAYKAKDSSDGFESLFCAISSIRATTRGSFIAPEGEGLVSITVSVGAARLVPASVYPDLQN